MQGLSHETSQGLRATGTARVMGLDALRDLAGILKARLGCEAIGKHDAEHVFRAHCVGRDRRRHCRVDAAGETKHNRRESVFANIVAQPDHAGAPRRFLARNQRAHISILRHPTARGALPLRHDQIALEGLSLESHAAVGA